MDTLGDNNQGWELNRSNTSHWLFLQLPLDVREAPIKLLLTLYISVPSAPKCFCIAPSLVLCFGLINYDGLLYLPYLHGLECVWLPGQARTRPNRCRLGAFGFLLHTLGQATCMQRCPLGQVFKERGNRSFPSESSSLVLVNWWNPMC